MPTRPPTACLKCGRPVTGASYHPECDPRPAQRAEHDRFRAQLPYRHLYNSAAWDRTRVFILARDPICRECNRAGSTIADHINDHKGNPKLFYDVNNLRGVCKPCHDKKTGTEHGFGTPSTPGPGGVQKAGSTTAVQSVDNRQVVGSNPTPPTTLPLDPIHKGLADGRVAMMSQYMRAYRKCGDRWALLDEDWEAHYEKRGDVWLPKVRK